MKVDLEQLENNEAILLMYLSGELGVEDRAEVDQMLSSDSGLRAELESLRAALDFSNQALRDLDGMNRPAVPEALAQRQIFRLMHDWAEERQQPVLVLSDDRPTLTIPWRRIGYSLAASVLVAVYLRAGYRAKQAKIDPEGHQFASQSVHQDQIPDQAETDPYAVQLSSPAQPQTVSSDEKLDLLASSLNDPISDESSNLRVAEVAAAIPMGTELDSLPGSEQGADHNAKSQNAGEP